MPGRLQELMERARDQLSIIDGLGLTSQPPGRKADSLGSRISKREADWEKKKYVCVLLAINKDDGRPWSQLVSDSRSIAKDSSLLHIDRLPK